MKKSDDAPQGKAGKGFSMPRMSPERSAKASLRAQAAYAAQMSKADSLLRKFSWEE